jgi:hypothetical protein
MTAREPPWLYLHEALDRVSARMFQQPVDALRTSQSLKVRYTLRDLLRTGDIEAYVRIKNRIVRLSVPVMLKVPFGIHYDGHIPGIEISKFPGQLLSLRLKTSDLKTSLNSTFGADVKKAKPPNAARLENATRWLVKKMQTEERQPKADCRTEVRRRFSITNKAFEAAWNDAQEQAQANWSKPGRF